MFAFERSPISPLLLAVVYLVWPLDLVPDMLGPLGRIDDVLVLAFVAWRMYSIGKRAGPATTHGHTTQTKAPEQETKFNPFDVLGLAPSASRDEVEVRYRDLAKKYHPDRVAHLGKEFQEIAHEKMVQIQRAYRALTANG